MHPNPTFRAASRDQNLGFARDRSFGVLSVNGTERPMLAHVPFVLDEAGNTADLHLVRSNPIARALKEPMQGVIAISGPDSYVSPDWYGAENQVPTWNYVAVHLIGRLEPLPQGDLRDLLDRESDLFESRLLPKPVWRADKMDTEALGKLLRMIVPCRFHIEDVDGTWKLGQNKTEAMRRSAAEAMEDAGIGADVARVAQMMRDA